MYIKSFAYTVAAVSVLISASAQPVPSDSAALAGTTAAALGYIARIAPSINPINGLPATGATGPLEHQHKHKLHKGAKIIEHILGDIGAHQHKHHHKHRHHKDHHDSKGHKGHKDHKHHKHHFGDMTYYTPGLGSCGITSDSNDMVVAVAEDLMASRDGGNPNANPWCGRHIHIHANGKSAKAKIVDTCPGCPAGDLDASPTLFQKFADLGVGRITGMHWTFAEK